MPLFEKKQQLSQSGKPEKMPPPKEEKEDTSIFGGKPFLRGEDLRGWAGSDTAYKTTNLPREERLRRIQELFGKDDFINREKAERKLRELQQKRFEATKDAEIRALDSDIKITKSILGK